MFPWIRPARMLSSRSTNLEAEYARCQKERVPCTLEGKAFYVQFAGATGVDEAREYALRDQPEQAAQAFFEHFQDRIRPIFFVHNSEAQDIRPQLTSHVAYCKSIIEASRDILAHSFSPLGTQPTTFPNIIDWFSDFGERSWPRMHIHDLAGAFTNVPTLIDDQLNPIELTWELNRHAHFVTLARAFWITGDENLAAEFLVQAVDWANSNPPSIGVNWLNDEVVATRAINWLLAINLFLWSNQFTPSLFVKLWSVLLLHGAALNWILRNTTKPSVAVATALFTLALAMPEFRGAQRWGSVAAKALEVAITNEFGSNGFHLSGSISEHRRQTEWLLLPTMVQLLNDTMPLASLETASARAIDALRALHSSSGCSPEIGPRLSGGFFGSLCGPAEHTERLLCAGAMALRQGHWRSAISEMPNEMYWWFGPAATEQFSSLEPVLPQHGLSTLYAEVGLGVARDTWDAKSTQFILRSAPAADYTSRLFTPTRPQQSAFYPTFHDDLLSIVLTAEDEPLLIEPSLPLTPGYPCTQMSRISAHSAPYLRGEIEPLPLAYSLQSDPSARTISCSPLFMETRGERTLMRAKRECLFNDKPSVIERCALFMPTEKLLIIRDTISSDDQVVPYECNLLLAPHLYLMMRGDMGCSVRGRKLHARIMPVFPPRSRHSITKGSAKPFVGWHVTENEQITAATNLRYFANLTTPASIYLAITWSRQPFGTPRQEQMDAWIDNR